MQDERSYDCNISIALTLFTGRALALTLIAASALALTLVTALTLGLTLITAITRSDSCSCSYPCSDTYHRYCSDSCSCSYPCSRSYLCPNLALTPISAIALTLITAITIIISRTGLKTCPGMTKHVLGTFVLVAMAPTKASKRLTKSKPAKARHSRPFLFIVSRKLNRIGRVVFAAHCSLKLC